ncbi:MAG: D-2-hydroxyacid dehydrogenase [Ruminococcus sp.]|jgi:glycerate dehydrogenase|nr:D-2-hydroxyacid dehydrogenase [Ruminococcus sp.]
MNAVILEAGTVSRGDIDFSPIENLVDRFQIFDFTPTDKTIEYVGDNEIVLCNKTPFTREVIKECKNLRYIGLCATGFNNIDLQAAKERNIVVTNVPGYATRSAAETVFAFLLEFAKRTSSYTNFVKNGGWIRAKSFAEFVYPTTEISQKTLGIIGYGAIGKQVSHIAEAFGMKVIVNTRTPIPGASNVSLEELFVKSDYISLHCPLTPQTEGLVNEKLLSLCKKGAVIINTSRGAVVDENALVFALESGKIAGAGLDVAAIEPMSESSPLWEYLSSENDDLPKLLISPHVAWAPIEARIRLVEIVAKNLKSFINENPINVVNRV